MFIPRYQDQIIANVEERLSKWLGIPVVNQEDMQVSVSLYILYLHLWIRSTSFVATGC